MISNDFVQYVNISGPGLMGFCSIQPNLPLILRQSEKNMTFVNIENLRIFTQVKFHIFSVALIKSHPFAINNLRVN
ncbi:MAG: hypothetical protein CM15mP111_4540 [Hyphomicrobiales bacterium]|nr:MAG: hypothetical protein CM15mP111_4540 [Hyphomicrobiales bacterium]